MDKQNEIDKEKERKAWVYENLANIITFSRLFFSIFILVLAICNPEQVWWMLTIAILIVLSDFADGKIARELNLTSPFGAALDQLGDKVFVVPSLIILSWRYQWVVKDLSVNLINFIVALIILLLFIETLLFWAWWVLFFGKKLQIHTNTSAKCKTFSIFPMVIVWLVSIAIERDFEVPVIEYSIYLIVSGLIIADIFGCAALKAYYRGYFEQEKVEELKQETKEKSPD